MGKASPKIGVDHLGYFPLTNEAAGGGVTIPAVYGAFYPLLGVTTINYNPNASASTYFGDDGAYETSTTTGEKDTTVNVAEVQAADYARMFGATYNPSTGKLTETKLDKSPLHALAYRSQKANGFYRYVILKLGRFVKPSESSQTKGATVAFQGQEVLFKGQDRAYDGQYREYIDSDDVSLPVGMTDVMLNSELTGWFSSPDYSPVLSSTPIADLAAVAGSADGEIDITFTAASGATSVKAQVSDPALGVWALATTENAMTAASTSATITGLTPGNLYGVRLIVIGGTKAGVSNTDTSASGNV